jgi:hypothetical protein
MIERYIATGWRLEGSEIREEGFFDGPSFSSVNAVLIDPETITDYWVGHVPTEKDGIRRTYASNDNGFGRTMVQLMSKRRAETADLLYKEGGIVVCRLRPRGEPLEVMEADGLTTRIDRYSWLPNVALVDRNQQFNFPANSRFLPRKGTDVLFDNTGNPFEDLLRAFEGRISYQAVYRDLLSTRIDRFVSVLAHNRVGDIIALQIPFDDGRLILLPPVSGISPAREARLLVRAISSASQGPIGPGGPDWLSAYPLPNEERLRDELTGLKDRRDRLNLKLEEISSSLNDLTRYKEILHTKGRLSLLPAVGDSFRALGFTVETSSHSLLLYSDEGDAIAVAEASEAAQIDLSPYRQLLNYVDYARTEGEGPGNGILVVSASRELDPKRRGTQFTQQVLRGCKSQGFCLITTYGLFKLAAAALQGEGDLSKVRRELLECTGEFRGD